MSVKQILVCDGEHEEEQMAEQPFFVRGLRGKERRVDLCTACIETAPWLKAGSVVKTDGTDEALDEAKPRRQRRAGPSEGGVLQLKCPGCRKVFNNGPTRMEHVTEEHPELLTFKCPEKGCTETYWSSGGLSIHLSKTHDITKDKQTKRHLEALGKEAA